MKKFDDKISQSILAKLRENSRISWQQLGAAVHLSPQACAERVRQMQDAGVIGGFTLRESGIESADKTSGDGCYHIVYTADTPAELEVFLARLSPHGRYRVASGLKRVVG